MKMNRRQFLEKSGHGALGTAVVVATAGGSMFVLEGCAFSMASVLAWTKVGNGTIGSIVNLLVGAGILACATCSVLANAAMAAITAIGAAVQNYQNADPTTKTSLLGKIQTALQAGLAASTAFFESLSIPGQSLASLIVGLAGLVLNAIAGFIGQVGTPAVAMARSVKVAAQSVAVTPVVMSAKQFQSAVNKLLVQYGYPQEVLH